MGFKGASVKKTCQWHVFSGATAVLAAAWATQVQFLSPRPNEVESRCDIGSNGYFFAVMAR